MSPKSSEPYAVSFGEETVTKTDHPETQSTSVGAADFDLKSMISDRQNDRAELFDKHLNPQLGKVLRTIGFERDYVKGSGSYLYDSKGVKYLDFLSSYGIFNTGRNHPVIKQAIRDYLDQDDPWKIQMGSVLLPGLLAEALLKRVPFLDKIHFTSSGTECVEGALKFTRCTTGREKVIYCQRAFHGLSYGSLSLNGCESFREGFVSFLPGATPIPFGDLDALEAELKKEPAAAFILEGIQGKGVFPAAEEFLLGAQKLCREYGTYLILDEIQTGMGRTGKLFLHQHFPGLEPDVLLVSKSLSGGMVPVGAIMMKEEIYKGVFSSLDRCVVHSSTFGQGGLAMTCGLAALHVLETEGLIENAADKGEKLMNGMRDIQSRHDLIKDVRGRGLMIGLELGKPKSMAGKTAWNMMHAADPSLFPQALIMPLIEKHHILTQTAGHHMDNIRLLPCLTIDDDDVAWFLNGLEDVIKDCNKFMGPVVNTAKHLIKFAAKK